MDSYVLGFAFDLDGQVALIQKNRPEWQEGHLNGIGGQLDDGEGHQMAMAREFFEETGVMTQPGDWDYRGIMRGEDWMVHVFSMTSVNVSSVQTTTDEEVYLLHPDGIGGFSIEAIENVKALIELCRIPVSQPSGRYPTFEMQYS